MALGVGCAVLSAVCLLLLVATFFIPADAPVPDDAVEGVVVGPSHPVPLAEPAVWSMVDVNRHMTASDDSGSNTLVYRITNGPSRISLQTEDGELEVEPGDPWRDWRLRSRVSANYNGFAELPALVREGRDPVGAGDFLSVRVFALHDGESVLVAQEHGETVGLWVGGRAAVEADRAQRRGRLVWTRFALGAATALLLLLVLGALGAGVGALTRPR